MRMTIARALACACGFLVALLMFACDLGDRPHARPYLCLPHDASGSPPQLLSRTGAFTDVKALIADRDYQALDQMVIEHLLG